MSASVRSSAWLAARFSSRAGTASTEPDRIHRTPGSAEGRARVILHPNQLRELEEGEILVAPSLSTSWTPVFGKVAAAVLDVGGIMCHAAIVVHKYGLPAVVATGTGTKQIKTADLIRVDADTGTILARD